MTEPIQTNRPTMNDLCSMHSYFIGLEKKSETAKEITRKLEQMILDKLNSTHPTQEPNT